jgi:hypothetical protein
VWQGQFISIMLYEHIKDFLFYFGDLMKGSHKFLVDVKMKTWTLEDHIVESLQIIFSVNLHNNQMNYANLPNHDKLCIIWR